jgi:hypothetical protein
MITQLMQGRIPPWTGMSAIAVGHSVAAGTGATTGWVARLAALAGLSITNMAVPSTTLMNRTPVDVLAGPNLVEQLSSIPARGSRWGIFIQHDINDAGIRYPAYSLANYRIDLETILADLHAKGYVGKRIVFVTGTYTTDAQWVDFVSYAGSPIQSTNAYYAQVQALNATIAAENLHQCFNFNQMGIDMGGSSVLDSLGRHPNDAYCAAIAAYLHTNVRQ